MATISNAQTRYQLTAKGSLTGVNVSGSGTIGVGLTTNNYSTADVFYSLRITSNAASDVATLNLVTGAVAQTTGSPNVTRWTGQTADLSGADLEGQTVSNATRLFSVFQKTGTITGNITAAASADEVPDFVTDLSNSTYLWAAGDSQGASTPGTIAYTFDAAADWVDVVVCGKST